MGVARPSQDSSHFTWLLKLSGASLTLTSECTAEASGGDDGGSCVDGTVGGEGSEGGGGGADGGDGGTRGGDGSLQVSEDQSSLQASRVSRHVWMCSLLQSLKALALLNIACAPQHTHSASVLLTGSEPQAAGPTGFKGGLRRTPMLVTRLTSQA